IRGTQVDGRDIGCRLVDEDACSSHEEILVYRSEFAGAVETGAAVIKAGSDNDMIVMPPNLRRARRLEGADKTIGLGPVPVDFTKEGVRRQGVKHGDVLIYGCRIIADAQLAGKRSTAHHGVGAIAVDMGRSVAAVVRIGVYRESVSWLPAS